MGGIRSAFFCSNDAGLIPEIAQCAIILKSLPPIIGNRPLLRQMGKPWSVPNQLLEIRMPAERSDRDVVPHPSVVFEAILQAFG